MLRRFTRVSRPPFDPANRRAVLVDKATSAQPGAALAIARHMARLRNFRTASQILSRVDLDELGLIDQCFAGITLLILFQLHKA